MERKVAALYILAAEIFPDNADFWDALSQEEETHAAIIHAGKDYFFEEGLFPVEILDPDLDRINALIFAIDEKSRHYKTIHPSIKDFLLFALEIELSSGEYYFQIGLSLPVEKAAVKIMRDLAEGERDHFKKIANKISEAWSVAA